MSGERILMIGVLRRFWLFGLFFVAIACQSMFQDDVDIYVDPLSTDLGEIDPLDQPYDETRMFSLVNVGEVPTNINSIALNENEDGWFELEELELPFRMEPG
jgi:hypothetical protein